MRKLFLSSTNRLLSSLHLSPGSLVYANSLLSSLSSFERQGQAVLKRPSGQQPRKTYKSLSLSWCHRQSVTHLTSHDLSGWLTLLCVTLNGEPFTFGLLCWFIIPTFGGWEVLYAEFSPILTISSQSLHNLCPVQQLGFIFFLHILKISTLPKTFKWLCCQWEKHFYILLISLDLSLLGKNHVFSCHKHPRDMKDDVESQSCGLKHLPDHQAQKPILAVALEPW